MPLGLEFRGHLKFYGDIELWSLEFLVLNNKHIPAKAFPTTNQPIIAETTWIGDSEPNASGSA